MENMENAIPQILMLLVTGICLAFGAAILWMLYLIKLATNEDALLRKIMEQQRRREEKRRAEEDKRRKRREAAEKSRAMARQMNDEESGMADNLSSMISNSMGKGKGL